MATTTKQTKAEIEAQKRRDQEQAEQAALDALWGKAKGGPLTREEAVTILADSDHAFLMGDLPTVIGAPFGFKPKYCIEQANVHWKGLMMPGEPPGTPHRGVAAEALAEGIARHLDGSFTSPYTGRGYRLRHACEFIEKHLRTAA